jgi:Protein of unknown function (DUF3102).
MRVNMCMYWRATVGLEPTTHSLGKRSLHVESPKALRCLLRSFKRWRTVCTNSYGYCYFTVSERSYQSSDIHVITAEINAYKRVAGEAIFEIGRRLKHVKENDLAHGQFSEWLKSIDFDVYQASRFIKVYEELSEGKLRTCANIGFRALYEIATLPPEERERPHTIPSTGETKTVDEMTVRELREVKKALKEAELLTCRCGSLRKISARK